MILMLLLMVANICAATAATSLFWSRPGLLSGWYRRDLGNRRRNSCQAGRFWHVALRHFSDICRCCRRIRAGIPAGVILGEWVGWRGVFGIVSLFSPGCVAADAESSLSAAGSGTGCPQFSDPAPPPGYPYRVVDHITAGDSPLYGIYNFVRPLLQQNPQLQAHELSGLLALYGIAGIAGNFVLGLLSGRHLFRAVFCITGGIALSWQVTPAACRSCIAHHYSHALGNGIRRRIGDADELDDRYSAQAIEITGHFISPFQHRYCCRICRRRHDGVRVLLTGNVIAALICAAMVLILICGFVIRFIPAGTSPAGQSRSGLNPGHENRPILSGPVAPMRSTGPSSTTIFLLPDAPASVQPGPVRKQRSAEPGTGLSAFGRNSFPA